MSGFIMTLDSDDEGPSPALELAPTSKKSKGKQPAGKLTRKEQLAAKKGGGKKDKKRKRMDDSSDEEGGGAAMGSDEEQLAEGFHFDGLGGGFIGEKKGSVWDSGQSYVTTRPNAIPRVTVDEIIARRAPERFAREAKRAEKAAAKPLNEEKNDLENEMMEALEGEMFDSEDGADENEEEEKDEDEEESDGNEGKGSEEDAEEESGSNDEDGDDNEEWQLGKQEIATTEDGEAPRGFAALADFDEEMSDEDDVKDMTVAVGRADSPAITDADLAAAKAYFTSHANATSTSTPASFATLPNCILSRQLLLALSSLSLTAPTPIQAECIPVAMLGKDIVASSKTGSGKTVAFWVGVIERLLHRDRKDPRTRVVVMCPTRELAVQVHGVGVALARYTDVQFCLCVGGLSLKVQEAELKMRPDVVVSTPGRLIDHVRNTPCFSMDAVEVLVLDEADRMLEEGFRAELEEIISAAPRSRQTLLFSATVTESIAQLSRLSMNKPVRVKIDEMGATASGLVQEFLRVRGDKAGEAIERGTRSGERSREALLVSLCTRSFASGRTIIFFRSKAQAHRMKIIFSLHGEGLERSDELHGDLTQDQRLASLRRFREGECAFLLATDLASRGLDIKGIENVINYEMPRSIEIYLHRVGRTARAGKKGRALTLVGESDRKLVKLAMKHAPPESIKQRILPPEVIATVSSELNDLEIEVKNVLREEREEKEFRRGDMEVTKGRNMIEHEMEIKSRPARTWFQTTNERNASKNAGLSEHNSKFIEKKKKVAEEPISKAPKRTPFSGLSRKEKRRKMAAAEDAEDFESGTKKEIFTSIRSAKKAARPEKMSVLAPPRPVSQPKKKKKGSKGGFERELGQVGGKGEGEKKMRPSPLQRNGAKNSKKGKGKAK